MSNVAWVGAQSRDASALPCTGIRGTINVVSGASIPLTGVVAAWVAIELTNSNWEQIGYYLDGPDVPEGFYQIWDLPTNSILSGGAWAVSEGSHQFELVYSGAGNVWDFLMDGTLEGSYDMGAAVSGGPTVSQPAEALVEQQQPPFTVPTIEFFSAMQVQQGGVWHDVATASCYASVSTYGVQGKDQNAALAPNQIVAGTAIAAVSVGTTLWTEAGGIESNSVVIFVAG